MGLKKLFSPSSRSTGSYTPVKSTDKNSEDSPKKPETPPPATTEILKNGHHTQQQQQQIEEDNWDLMEYENLEKFSRAFLAKAQSQHKKKVTVDQKDHDDDDGGVHTKPTPFCGTAGKRRSSQIALAVLNKHLEREVKLLKRKSPNPATYLVPSETERFDRFFIQLAVDIFYTYEHQLRHVLKLGGGGAGGGAREVGKTNENENSDKKNESQNRRQLNVQALQAVAEFTARICFSKFSNKKLENLSKEEILHKTLTQCDATTKKAAILKNKETTALQKREARTSKKLSKICLDDNKEGAVEKKEKKIKKDKKVAKDTKDHVTNEDEKDTAKENEPKDDNDENKDGGVTTKEEETKSKISKSTKTQKKDTKKGRHHDNKDKHHGDHHGDRANCDRGGVGANFKFFADTLPAFYCPSSQSLLVQEKDCKKLLRGPTEPGDIALKLRKPFKLEWDQMQRRRRADDDLKSIDHLVDGSEEELKKFVWTDRSDSVGQIYLANLMAIAAAAAAASVEKSESEEEAEIKKRFKEAFIKLDQDVDQTQDVIREMEAKLQQQSG